MALLWIKKQMLRFYFIHIAKTFDDIEQKNRDNPGNNHPSYGKMSKQQLIAFAYLVLLLKQS